MKSEKMTYLLSHILILLILFIVSGCGSSHSSNSSIGNENNCDTGINPGNTCDTVEQLPPVAKAGSDITVDRGSIINLNASASYDGDGNIISYTWFENGNILGTGMNLTLNTLPLGNHVITLKVKDNDGKEDSDTLNVTIEDWDTFALCTYSTGCEPWRINSSGTKNKLLKDIQPGNSDAYISGGVTMDSYIYFFAFDGFNPSLWRLEAGSDTEPEKIYSFPSINALLLSNQGQMITKIGNTIYFSILNNSFEAELWKSNGTEASTQKVKTINQTGQLPHDFIATGGKLFFIADDGTNGDEIWVSDGTYNGTHMVSIIQDDSVSGNIGGLTAYGTDLYFYANDGTTGYELWKTNGTPAGTVQVKDINPGAGDAKVSDLEVAGAYLYFRADDGTHGSELWQSDGTSTGTKIIKDIIPGAQSSYPNQLTATSDGTLYFQATNTSNGRELWQSDGTASGTKIAMETMPGSTSSMPLELTAINNRLYFTTDTSNYGREIYEKSSSSSNQITMFDSRYSEHFIPKDLFNGGGKLFYNSGSPDRGWELYTIDNGNNMIKDIAEGAESSNPKVLGSFTGMVYFTADDGISGRELWRSDGTMSGTDQVADINTMGKSSILSNVIKLNNQRYFITQSLNSSGHTLWHSDGTEDGTYKVQVLQNSYTWLKPFKNKLYFPNKDVTTNEVLQRLDPGTNSVENIHQFKYINGEEEPVIFQNRLCFVASDSIYADIWCTDGTMMQKITNFQSLNLNAEIKELTVMGNTLYFVAYDGATHGTEIWKSDGTPGGVSILKDIMPGGQSSYPKELTVFNDKLYFVAKYGLNGEEIWMSDGSDSGTQMLRDIAYQIGASSKPDQLTATTDRLYFTANGPLRGRELWRSDGTENGTLPVADIKPGGDGSSPKSLYAWGTHIAFDADDGTHGRQLWMISAADQSPVRISDIPTDFSFFLPRWKALGVLNDKLLFELFQSTGIALYNSDGSFEGTHLLWEE